MRRKLRKDIFEGKDARELFKREIAETRQLVKDILINKRESAKTPNIKYLSTRV